jgi:hypothetical protein
MSGHPIAGQLFQTSLSQQALARMWPSENSLNLHRPTTMAFAAASPETVLLEEQIKSLKIPPSPGALKPTATSSIEESLFDATATVKMLTAQVAMHLDREWRTKLFRQLDSLHEPSEWERSDSPVQQSSFATFLKAICDIKPTRRPGLGLTSTGHLIAAWTTNNDDRLTIEFLPTDRVRWVISTLLDGDIERLAGHTNVTHLRDRLQPYEPGRWFDNAKKS